MTFTITSSSCFIPRWRNFCEMCFLLTLYVCSSYPFLKIRLSTTNLLKQNLVYSGKMKLQEEYARKKDLEVAHRVARSTTVSDFALAR